MNYGDACLCLSEATDQNFAGSSSLSRSKHTLLLVRAGSPAFLGQRPFSGEKRVHLFFYHENRDRGFEHLPSASKDGCSGKCMHLQHPRVTSVSICVCGSCLSYPCSRRFPWGSLLCRTRRFQRRCSVGAESADSFGLSIGIALLAIDTLGLSPHGIRRVMLTLIEMPRRDSLSPAAYIVRGVPEQRSVRCGFLDGFPRLVGFLEGIRAAFFLFGCPLPVTDASNPRGR